MILGALESLYGLPLIISLVAVLSVRYALRLLIRLLAFHWLARTISNMMLSITLVADRTSIGFLLFTPKLCILCRIALALVAGCVCYLIGRF